MDVNKKLASLQEVSKVLLSKILTVNSNTKHFILEPHLIRPLERVCGVKWLKSHGVEKIFKLDDSAPNFNANAVFYMIFANATTFTKAVNQIRTAIDLEKPIKNKFHIIVVPRVLYAFEEELEQLGLLYSAIKLHSFQWLPIHLDTGVLSLEIPNVYSSLFVYENTTFLPTLSKTLWQLSFVVGKPRFILAIGKNSNSLLYQYDTLCEDRADTDKLESEFGSLVIIDRNVDYPSTLLTPGIYSALLNEVYGIYVGICDNKDEVTEKLDNKCNPVTQKQQVSFHLDSTQDSVYADIKNRYFTEVTSVLSSLTKQLKSEKINSKEMALDEIKRYVQTQLQVTKTKKKFITNHLMAAESIINVLGHRFENQREVELNVVKNVNKATNFSYLEEMLNIENDKLISLRLFCLMCSTQKLTDSEVQLFWRKFLHQFGFKYGFAYQNLVNMGFIPESAQSSSLQSKILKIPKFSSSNFYVNSKNLRQVPADPAKINIKYPTCASYVFGGAYIPLITQICSMLLNSTPLDEIKLKLEGFGNLTVRNDRGYPLQSRSVLVYIIGGVTYAEIAACNLLENITGSQIVILSDKIVTGNVLMQSILDFPK